MEGRRERWRVGGRDEGREGEEGGKKDGRKRRVAKEEKTAEYRV